MRPEHAHIDDVDLYERFYNVDPDPDRDFLIGAGEPRVKWAKDRIKPGQRVLDVGCNKGGATISLAKLTGANFSGVDIGRFAIVKAQNLAEAIRVNYGLHSEIDFRVAWAEDLPFEDSQFDRVLLLEILEHVRDTRVVIAEAERVAKPGGLIITSTPMDAIHLDEGATLIEGYEHLRMHVREYDPAVELAGKANLELARATSPNGVDFYLSSYTVTK